MFDDLSDISVRIYLSNMIEYVRRTSSAAMHSCSCWITNFEPYSYNVCTGCHYWKPGMLLTISSFCRLFLLLNNKNIFMHKTVMKLIFYIIIFLRCLLKVYTYKGIIWRSSHKSVHNETCTITHTNLKHASSSESCSILRSFYKGWTKDALSISQI